MQHHTVPIKLYLQIYAALMALLLVTVGAAYVHLGMLGIVVAAMITAAEYMIKTVWRWKTPQMATADEGLEGQG